MSTVESLIGQITNSITAFDTRVKGKVLLIDNPSLIQSQKIEKRQALNRKKLAKKSITGKQKKAISALTMLDLSYSDFTPLNKLWLQYMKDVIGSEKCVKNTFPRLVKADFHGALFSGITQFFSYFKTVIYYSFTLFMCDKYWNYWYNDQRINAFLQHNYSSK